MEYKNLANCKPSEFVAQTVRIKKAASEWLTATDLLNILRTRPNYRTLANPATATAEEKAQILRENVEIQQEQGMKNFSAIIDAAFEKNPEKTLEILALCCFVEPNQVDEHPMSWYFESMDQLLHDQTVINFFSSLAQLAKKNTSKQ